MREWAFAAAIGVASRATSLYEWLRPAASGDPLAALPGMRFSRHSIRSGQTSLDAIYAEPLDAISKPARPRAVVLICHGIGEIVEWWLPVQRLLAANGVASLVFDYSGYGRSRGRISAAQFEADAASAFAYLEQLAPGEPVAALGFSLGTGVLAGARRKMRASRLVLCEGFPSFREAACRVCMPRALQWMVPPVWDAAETMRGCELPVLVVHAEEDRLFPVEMGRELHASCGPAADFLLIPGHGHTEPFNQPRMEYWGPVIRWLSGFGLEWGDRRR